MNKQILGRRDLCILQTPTESPLFQRDTTVCCILGVIYTTQFWPFFYMTTAFLGPENANLENRFQSASFWNNKCYHLLI